jgi:integrase
LNDLEKIKKSALPLTGSSSYDSAIKKINAEANISPAGLKQYFQSLRDRGLTVATLNHKIAAVKKSLKIMAERMGQDSWRAKYELEQIFNQNDLKRIKVEQFIKPEDCITRKQLKKLIKIADEKTGLIIQCLYYTACRISELNGIRYIDCKSVKKGVEIKIIGKGRKLRAVYIPKKLFFEIREAFNGKTYFFETRTGRRIDRSNLWRQISRAGKSAGIKRLHPHTFRHTWATHNLSRLGLHKVSKYLGHAEISTTSKFYIHNNPNIGEILEQGELF